METWVGPLQWLLGLITAGIYVPTTVRVFCRTDSHPMGERRIDIPLDERTVARAREAIPNVDELLPAAIRKFEAEARAARAAARPPTGEAR